MRQRALVILASLAIAAPAAAQDVSYATADRAPRFMYSPGPSQEPYMIDVASVPAMGRRITLDLQGVERTKALAEIARMSGLQLVYAAGVVPTNGLVKLKAEDITVAAALTEVLFDARVDVVLSLGGTVVLVKRSAPKAPIQVGTITGVVTDSATREPIRQAQVSVAGTSLGRSTDDNGRYTIANVPAGARTLAVRRLGFDPQSREVNVTDGATVTADFELVGATTRLAEIVTTVTGGQRRMEMGTAIANIRPDSLMQIAPVMNFGDLLQGRAPGVLSMSTSGMAGQAGRVRIRGLNSFSVSNDPIVIIDGARVEAGAADGRVGGSGLTGRFSDIDPDEIEAIEVVKGPTAATLYGTDAANGVIVVTTKRGRPGRMRKAIFTEQAIVQQVLQFEDLHPNPYYAFGRNSTTNAPQRCTLLQRAASSCTLDSLRSFDPFDDPQTSPFKDSRREEYGLQLSGGTTQGATYFLSGGYERETGTWHMPPADQTLLRRERGISDLSDWKIRPNAFSRVNLRANVSTPLAQRGNATLASSFVSNEARQPAGFPLDLLGYRDINDGWANAGQRPAYRFERTTNDKVRRFVTSLSTSYVASNWFTLRGAAGADFSTSRTGMLIRRGEGFPTSTNFTGFRSTGGFDVAVYSVDIGVTAVRAASLLSSRTSAGLQFNRRNTLSTTMDVANLPLGGETVAGGTVGAITEATLGTAVAGAYLEEVLAYRERLFVTGALRFDGGSAFGEDFSLAIYPKAGISWLAVDGGAGRMDRALRVLNTVRLRAAYGSSGVQPGPTAALPLVTVSSGVPISGTTATPGAIIGNIGNRNLKPERSNEIEGGFDVELWNSRAKVDLTAYQRTSEDALVLQPLGLDVGGGSRWENIGTVRNRGVELQMTADLIQRELISVGLSAGASRNSNRLTKLGEGIIVTNPASEGPRQDVGYPVFGLWGRRIQSYSDGNGNGIIEPAEIVLSENQFIGPSFPGREATFAPYARFLNDRIRLNALVQYRGGFYHTYLTPGGACSTRLSFCRAANDIATPLDEQAKSVAAAQFGARGDFMLPASYTVLREIALSFTLPQSLVQRVRANDARLLLAGRNLALLWKESSVPIESQPLSHDADVIPANTGPSTYWMIRVALTF